MLAASAQKKLKDASETRPYRHPEASTPLRPEVGAQDRFRQKKAPQTYRYDPSLAPELNYDGQNPGRETAESALAEAARQVRQFERDLAARREELRREMPADRRAAVEERIAALDAARCAAESALDTLQRASRPFLQWPGKAERLSFNVPTLPLFTHERLSTKAILETLKAHRRKERKGTSGKGQHPSKSKRFPQAAA